MAELSKELYNKLLLADSLDEVATLLKADGREDMSAQEVWEQVQQRRAQDGVELSLDELEDVAGGRDWMAQGCAATVERGSDCWGTDSCALVNVVYEPAAPNSFCPKCGRQAVWKNYTVFCRNCGEYRVSVHGL